MGLFPLCLMGLLSKKVVLKAPTDSSSLSSSFLCGSSLAVWCIWRPSALEAGIKHSELTYQCVLPTTQSWRTYWNLTTLETAPFLKEPPWPPPSSPKIHQIHTPLLWRLSPFFKFWSSEQKGKIGEKQNKCLVNFLLYWEPVVAYVYILSIFCIEV